MYQSFYSCRNWLCKGCVRIERTYCEPCYLAYKYWAPREVSEREAVALMQEYAA